MDKPTFDSPAALDWSLGRYERIAVRERTFEILEAANEHPDGFRITSRYVVATLRR